MFFKTEKLELIIGYHSMKVINFQNKLKKKSQGSMLVFVMILLVNALIIVSTITAISVSNYKASSQSRISASAIEAADGGMEWALNVLRSYSGNPSDQLSLYFNNFSGSEGVGCPAPFNQNPTTCRVYFLKENYNLLGGNNLVSDVHYIRSVGKEDKNGTIVTRSLQAQFGH